LRLQEPAVEVDVHHPSIAEPVALKTRPLLLIWILFYFLGLNFFSSNPTVASKFKPPNLFQRE
jgi:hypothetical protein